MEQVDEVPAVLASIVPPKVQELEVHVGAAHARALHHRQEGGNGPLWYIERP